MLAASVLGYLSGWAVVTLGTASVPRLRRYRHGDPTSVVAMSVRVTTSVLAGALWPVLIVAIAQVAAIACAGKALHLVKPARARHPTPILPTEATNNEFSFGGLPNMTVVSTFAVDCR